MNESNDLPKIQIDLQPLVERVVHEVLANVPTDMQSNHRIAYPESEAVGLLGVPQHTLRDCRLRGELQGSKIGKRICYSREELLNFIKRNRVQK